MPPAALLPAQTRLGGYEIMELVGRGGMGEVYRARQVSMDRIVALKVLSPRLAAKDPSFAQQFIAEARAAGRLNHAHIVHVHDVASALAPEGCGVAGELHYFSMEFIDGETVKDVLERQGRLEPDQVARVMRGMGEALVYAQSQDLIHRDIKPDNIMLGSDGSVKLADLGLATDLETATNEAGGKVMGTPLYMSPEQARALALDHRSDQYSLGATLFHCLTGRPPYTGDSAKGIMKAHVVEPVPDPRALREDVPEAWRQLCLRLMAKEPAARFPDAVAMRLAIEAAAQGRAVRARTATAHPAHRRPPRRSPLLVGAVAAGVVAAVAVAAVVASGGGEAPSSPVPPPADLSTRPATVAARPAAEPPAPSLEDALARLPREPRQRLEGLRALIDGPFRASPERRRIDAMIRDLEGDLAAAAARTAAERADRFTKGLAAAESALAAGRLADAGDQIAALKPADAGEDGAAKVADLRARLDQALARARGGFDERIAAADDVRTLDGIAGELRAAALPAPEARRLDAAIATRRAALSSAAAAADAEHLERVVAAVEEQRRTPRYAELQARLTQLMAPIQGPEGRATADRYLRAVRLAAQVEADIQAHIKAKEPEATLRLAAGQTATVRLTALGPDRVSFRRGSAAPVTAERAGIELPLADLAAAAAAAGPERGDALTAFAWHWRLPALTGTGDRAFAAQLAEHDRRLRPLPVVAPCEREDGAAVATYDFIARGPALLPDWQGDAMRAGPRGLHWDNARSLPPGDIRDRDLPTLRWAAAVRAPAVLAAKIAMDSESALAVGFSDGGQAVRVLLVNRGASREPVRLLTVGDGGRVAVEGARGVRVPAMTPDRPVPVRVEVDAEGRVRLLVGETAIANEIPRLDPARPLTVVVQTTGQTRAAIPWLQVRGLPPGNPP